MKYKIHQKLNKQQLRKKTLILLLMSTQSSMACIVNNINKTQMQIYSNHQNINIMTNTLTITGNIVVQINSINIYADKIFITYSNKSNKEKTIDIYGNPVIFYQFEKNQQMLATSSHMCYKTYDDTIILKGTVYLKKENHILQSNCIKYTIKKKYITTCNNHNDLDKTIFTINIHKNYTNVRYPSISSQSNQKK